MKVSLTKRRSLHGHLFGTLSIVILSTLPLQFSCLRFSLLLPLAKHCEDCSAYSEPLIEGHAHARNKERRMAHVATCISVPYSLLHVNVFRGDDLNFSREGYNEMIPCLKNGLLEFRRPWSRHTTLPRLSKTKMALMNAWRHANKKVQTARGVHQHGSRRLMKVPKYGSWNCPIHNLHQFTTKTVMVIVGVGLVVYVQSRKNGRFKETSHMSKYLHIKQARHYKMLFLD